VFSRVMQDREPRPPKETEDETPFDVDESNLQSSGEVVVRHHDRPPKGPPDKRIHPRRPLPRVPDAPPDKPD